MSTQSSLQSLLEARTNLGILHARTFEARPSQNRKPKSILELVATGCPTAQKQQLVYVVADLKRSSNNESWGISFSQFDGHMILGEVKTRMKQRITWSAVILGNEHILDHKQVYQSAKTQPSRAQYREIVKYYARSIQTAGCTVHNQVLPGDMIVAIDGFQPNEFSSLHEITNYLRNSIHLSLILVRHPQPTAAALALYSMPSLNAAHNQSGTAAYHVWRVLLDPIAPIARQVPMARQVTPDVGAAAAAASRNSSLMVSHMDPIAHLGLRLQQSLWNQKLLSNLAAGNGTALSLSPHHAMAAPHFKPIHNIKKRPLVPTTTTIPPLPDTWRNPWFQKDNRSIPYDDNWEFSPEDGNRAQLFLPPIHDFQYWLRLRKNKWRRNYKVFKHLNKDDHEDDHEDETLERDSCTVSKDFWTHQGLSSFDAWLQHRRERWRTNYKVYRNKRRRIHKECEEIVHLNNPSMEAFNHWLQIRKNQWKVLRRKRQRQREENKRGPIEIETRKAPNNEVTEVTAAAAHNPAAVVTPDKQDRGLDCTLQRKRRKFLSTSATDIDMACIDDILEEEERERKARAERPPIDISFLFDANKMAPDDVVVRVFEYLDRKEHGKLLCVNKETSESLKARDDVWRQLCPSNWVLRKYTMKSVFILCHLMPCKN